jgi:glyoxylase-like metal-dependent hydrolase (beta-lactamase superfamily II)
VSAQESFGRLEEVGEGLFALISTPLTGDYTTVSNGGIIAGRDGVLVVEALQTAEGAEWLARQARELTGRWPTHVVVTHYHSDHTRGVAGYAHGGLREGAYPSILGTQKTQELTLRSLGEDVSDTLRRLLADIELVEAGQGETIDLGGRIVRLVPRDGHTPSDVSVELPDDGLVWCGDLVWNGMFPNYMDAQPSKLSKAVRLLASGDWQTWVPGHGPLASSEDLGRYIAVIDGIEETARHAVLRGMTAEEAGEAHAISTDLGEWTLFNPNYFQRAIEAWMRELG